MSLTSTRIRGGRRDNDKVEEKKTRIFSKLGEGTLDEPFLYWVVDPRKLNNKERTEKCAEIARQQARKNKCLAAVIRKENHDTQNGRDPETGMLTGTQEVADNHITLYLGSDINDIQLGGHVYTNTDKDGVPIGVMDPEERKIIPPGQEKCSTEFWPVRNQPYEHIDPNNVENSTSAIRMGVYPLDHDTSYYLRPSDRNYRRYRERDRSDLPRSRFSRDRSRSPGRYAYENRSDPRSGSSRDRSRSPRRRDASENRRDPTRSSSSRDRSRSRRDGSTERRDSSRSSSSRHRSRSPRREPSTDRGEPLSRMSRRDHLDKNDLFYAKELPRPKPSMARGDSPHSVPSTDKKDVDPDGKQRSRLSESERARRITSGLCVYCGKPGHRRENCPESSHTRKVETPWPDIGSLY
jgi:hypothetical protein